MAHHHGAGARVPGGHDLEGHQKYHADTADPLIDKASVLFVTGPATYSFAIQPIPHKHPHRGEFLGAIDALGANAACIAPVLTDS